MPKSLADLRASSAVGLAERSFRLCLAPRLLAKIEELDEQFHAAHGAEEGRPTRMVDGESEALRLAREIDEVRAEMAEHTGTLLLRAREAGDWRQWCLDNPAREDNKRDRRMGFDLCNFDALLDDLGRYAVEWNGEPLGDGDWEFIRSKTSAGSLDQIAQTVLAMHESAVDVPKSRLDWLRAQQTGDDSK